MKKQSAEKELENAKEMCEKMRKKRSAFLGSLRIAHSASLDETDHKIMNARTSLEDVKLDLQERSSRWYEIEKICGFSIMANPGLHALSSMLNQSTGYLGYSSASNLMNGQGLSGSVMSMGDSEEDQPPGYFAATGTVSRRKHTSTSSHSTPFASIPLSSSTFTLATKRRNLQLEKDSKTDSHEQRRFLPSVKTQPELFNLEKSKLTMDFNLEKSKLPTDFNFERSKLAGDLGKLDGFKACPEHHTISSEPRKIIPESYKTSLDLDKINKDSLAMDPFRVTQETLKIGRESFKIDDIAQDDFKVGNDIFKDGPNAFKIGQAAFKGSKDSKIEDRDHGDSFSSPLDERPLFDVGDACPGYETLLEDNIGKMQVGAARSGLVRSLHQNDQLYFQKSLPSSLSDSSLMMVGPESVMEKPARKMVPVSPRALLSMSLDEDVSSPESTDSAGPQEDKPKKKRLIRRTLLPKLLKNSPLVDKQKVC